MGQGRLALTNALLAAARKALGAGGALASKRVVVTAGGTQEAIDPVRYIGNRSSGRMGVSLAQAAAEAGADVHLIATRSVDSAWLDGDAEVVESARDLQQAVERAVTDADVLIMAAAVADFRPETVGQQKIKKQQGQETLDLRLVRNPDIIAGIDRPGLMKVGFAAETESLLENARQKLASKGLAMIVANEAVATIGSERSVATLITRDREPRELPEAAKDEVAREIVQEIARLLGEESAGA
jgi:phosphopantothenoylcysteine decarboxylase/phosphopantothenate--cysteine ligase